MHLLIRLTVRAQRCSNLSPLHRFLISFLVTYFSFAFSRFCTFLFSFVSRRFCSCCVLFFADRCGCFAFACCCVPCVVFSCSVVLPTLIVSFPVNVVLHMLLLGCCYVFRFMFLFSFVPLNFAQCLEPFACFVWCCLLSALLFSFHL